MNGERGSQYAKHASASFTPEERRRKKSAQWVDEHTNTTQKFLDRRNYNPNEEIIRAIQGRQGQEFQEPTVPFENLNAVSSWTKIQQDPDKLMELLMLLQSLKKFEKGTVSIMPEE